MSIKEKESGGYLLEGGWLNEVVEVGQDAWCRGDLGQQVHFQVGREGVGQAHVAGEGAQDEVAHLDAVGRDHVAEAVVVVAQELREVVQQHKQDTQGALQHKSHIQYARKFNRVGNDFVTDLAYEKFIKKHIFPQIKCFKGLLKLNSYLRTLDDEANYATLIMEVGCFLKVFHKF